MRIAFVGKGGSGKTTAAALFSSYASTFVPTFVFDADLNQHITATLGTLCSEKTLSDCKTALREEIRGANDLYVSSDMIKTTPPGRGSRLYRTAEELRQTLALCSVQSNNLTVVRVGEQEDHDVGIRCYHAKTGVLELLLNHIVDDHSFIICVDMTAGIDAFSSGLFAQFDLTVMLVEPTMKSVAVFQQYAKHAQNHGVRVVALGNKVMTSQDEDFLRNELQDALLGSLKLHHQIVSAEQGKGKHLDALHDPHVHNICSTLYQTLQEIPKDWNRYQRVVYELHKRNAESWGNAAVGKELAHQIDPAFSYAAVAASS